ncbi:MAG: transcriptional regulator FtrA [Pirellulaceae bacterium]
MLPRNLNVVAVAYDRLAFFEFGIAVEVFGLPRPDINPWYRFATCTAESGPIRTLAGISLQIDRGLKTLDRAGTIIIPGWRDIDERPPEALLRALRRAHDRGARVMSLCSGAFVLAAAGLLDGRAATTHWRYAERLQRDYPDTHVDPKVLYIDGGSILTAAGSAAGIDLCLHVVRRDFGAETANKVARRLVVPPHRDGGQAQFIDRPVTKCEDTRLASLLQWLQAHLTAEHSIASMAERASMTSRTFARRFREQTGTTPAKWLAFERIKLAQRLLETTTLGIDQIAARSGFASAQLLRIHFRKIAGRTPTAYRTAFRQRR